MRKEQGDPITKGLGASPGRVVGTAKVVFSPEEAKDKIGDGDVLVTMATDPAFTPYMEKSVAIVTDIGGILSHAAIVSRELGIPCVVGCNDATEKLTDDMTVLVDGLEGLVWKARE